MLSSIGSSLILLLILQSLSVAATESYNLRHNNQDNSDDSSSTPEERNRNLIVNGVEAQANEFPWFASMLRESPDEQPGCGGTLIAPNRVLTAAHCMIPTQWIPELGPPAYVRVGHTTHDNGEVIPVDCVTIHPSYIPHYNDLAIVKLARNVTTITSSSSTISTLPMLSNSKQPVPLILPAAENATNTSTTTSTALFATLNTDPNYPSTHQQPLTVIGFGAPRGWIAILGTLFSMGRIPKTKRLQKLTTNFVTEDQCRTEYACADSRYHACAKSEENNEDRKKKSGVCYGDSGGPLLDANNLVVGVTSFKGGGGYGCAEGFPDVYMNVANYREWIQQEIRSDTCSVFMPGATRFQRPCREA